MNPHPEIELLARKVAQRHNVFLLRRVIITSLFAASSVLALASLIWITRGHSVPWHLPIALLIAAIAVAFTWFLTKRMDTAAAILEADRHFDLKDGITTARYLASNAPEETAARLQWQWLSPRLSGCDPNTITRPFPRKLAATSAILVIAATVLCLIPPSESVRAAEEQPIPVDRGR